MQNLAPQSLLLEPNRAILPNIGFLSSKQFSFRLRGMRAPSFGRTVIWRCRNSPEENAVNSRGNGDWKDSLSGVVGEQVEELLNREENKGLLDGLEKASMRVEMAKRELAEIERLELAEKLSQDYVNQLETRASEIAECQREIVAAKAKIEEAERNLSLEEDDDLINRDMERLESAKAAAIAALIGTIAEIPISVSQVSTIEQLILPLGIAFVSCGLFGVTFRYAVRGDLDNFQLKSGTAAAFGFVKGLGMLSVGPPLEFTSESLVSHVLDGAVLVSESLLIFAFALVALDFCFKIRLLRPFPSSSKV